MITFSLVCGGFWKPKKRE